jgi:pilus assembly protein Flp/PilA
LSGRRLWRAEGALSLTLLQKENKMRNVIQRFRREEEGAALVEYGMLVGLIAVICVVAVTTLGTEVSTAFSVIAAALSAI